MRKILIAVFMLAIVLYAAPMTFAAAAAPATPTTWFGCPLTDVTDSSGK